MYCPACKAEYPFDWQVCPKDRATLLKSKSIGKYEITGLLGVGGMGAVYRALNPDTHGEVAIKVMNPDVASSEELRQRFQREAAVVAKLRTSHVVKIYDFGAEADGALYLVMEFLDGHQLRDEITPMPEPMDLARVVMVMDGALKGLAAAHKVGIVHRDLKPENIYVADTDDGELPKLLDFGIARVQSRDAGLTRTGAMMGTASYMAPEQVSGHQAQIGPWTDIFAMGAILYELLAGAPCFGGATLTEVLRHAQQGVAVPLSTVRAGLPQGIYDLIAKCLDVDPTKRPQDAEAMRMQLAHAQLVAPGVEIPPARRTQEQRALPSDKPELAPTGYDPTATPAPASQSAPGNKQVVAPYRPAKSDPPPPAPLAGTAPPPAEPVAPKQAKWPLAVVAIVVIGGGGAVAAVKLGGGSGGTAPPPPVQRDAAVTAALPVDAAAVAPGGGAPPADAFVDNWDTKGPDLRTTMVHFAARERDLGEPAGDNKSALPAQHAKLGEYWIDRTEMTLGELRDALTHNLEPSTAGGRPGDGLTLPARNITYAQAEAACKARKKRLPTELEWEAAALDTPQDALKATMKQALVPSKHVECSYDGLCDMLGSVAEWTSSDFSPKEKVVRGSTYTVSPQKGGWEATIHARSGQPTDQPDPEIGVRCVMDVAPK